MRAAFPARTLLEKAEPPAVVVDHDADVIWVVEGSRGLIVRDVAEVPLRRIGGPHKPVEVWRLKS